MNNKLLHTIGLNESEIKLYRAIFDAREITPTELAKVVDVKRTSAYSMTSGLVEKGLVIEDSTKRPMVFRVSKPEELENAIEFEKRRSKEQQGLLTKLSDEVQNREAEERYPVPQIKFIEEDKLESFLQSRMGVWNKSIMKNDGIFWGYQDPSFVVRYEKWIESFWKNAPKDLQLQLLSNDAKVEERVGKKYERRHIKFWSNGERFLSTNWVLGNYVVTINTQKRPFYLVEIHDKLMAHDQREVFKNLWGTVK